jgi:hypothetical protein
MRGLFPMGTRALIRWVVWAVAWGFALFAARPAFASGAPMCDERGASMIAPPPTLQAPDAKIDVGAPFGCARSPLGAVMLGARGRVGTVVIDQLSIDEAWLRPAASRIPSRNTEGNLAPTTNDLSSSPGHGRGVFRPPRG